MTPSSEQSEDAGIGLEPRREAIRGSLLRAGLPLGLLLLGTLAFRTTGADLAISDGYYAGEKEGWASKNHPFFALLYDKGTLPAAALAGIAVLVLLGGLVWASLRRWRKICIYYILVVVIAPGLLVNAVFKEHWGRPRPRDVTEFGGHERFEKVWEYDAASPGKSFPSGHASMGFCLFALYFIGRALRERWAIWALVVALALGGALGLARVAQGGHFASDVLWSAGFCYFTALGLARLLRLERKPFSTGGAMTKAGWAGLGVVFVGAAALAVAVPYQDEKRIESKRVGSQSESVEIEICLVEADLLVRGGTEFVFRSHVEAFGLLGSKVEDRLDEGVSTGGPDSAALKQNLKGSFAIFEQPATLELPTEPRGEIDLELEEGSVVVELFESTWDWDVSVGEGDIELRVPEGMAIKISRASVSGTVSNSVPGLEWSAEKGRWKRGDEPKVKVRVSAGGDLRLVPLNR